MLVKTRWSVALLLCGLRRMEQAVLANEISFYVVLMRMKIEMKLNQSSRLNNLTYLTNLNCFYKIETIFNNFT